MNKKLISAMLGGLASIPLTLTAINNQNKPSIPVRYDIHMESAWEMTLEDRIYSANTPVEVAEKRAYFDVPLSEDIQDVIFDECEKYSISPALVIAMIETESTFRADVVSNDKSSTGLMQVCEKWHRDRMDKLGCDDLKDPAQNIMVGVDYLAELYGKYEDNAIVLTAYNCGEYADFTKRVMREGIVPYYARTILARAEELETCRK